MPGASPETRRVKTVNANWNADADAPDGRFELMLITDDDARHFVPVSPTSMTALVALARAETVLAWDPTNRTLVAANLVGRMPWTQGG